MEKFGVVILLLSIVLMVAEGLPHHHRDSSSSEEDRYYEPRPKVVYRYKNYYNYPPHPASQGSVSSVAASASASSSTGLVEQPIPPAGGGYYQTDHLIDTRIAHRQPLLPTMSPEEVAVVNAESQGRPQPLLPTVRPELIVERDTVHPKPLLPTQRPHSSGSSASSTRVVVRQQQRVQSSDAGAVASASASAGAAVGNGNGGGGAYTVVEEVRPGGYYTGYDHNNVNTGVSTILDGVGKGSLAEVLRGSFAFTRNPNVKNIANNVIDSIFGRRGTDYAIWPALNNNGKK